MNHEPSDAILFIFVIHLISTQWSLDFQWHIRNTCQKSGEACVEGEPQQVWQGNPMGLGGEESREFAGAFVDVWPVWACGWFLSI